MVRAYQAVARRLAYRHQYNRLSDWLLSYYDSFLRRFRNLPLPYRDKLFRVSLKAVDQPFFVRLERSDAFVLEEVFLQKEYGAHLAADLGDVRQIVDLGGNVGMTARLWRMHFPAAQILVVEPDAGNCEILRKNVGDAKNIQIVQACIGAVARQAYLDTSMSECAYQMVDHASRDCICVPVKTVPQLLEEHGLAGDIDLLKCDIEGGEEELFADCRAWIGRVRNLSIELHNAYTHTRLLEDLRKNGANLAIAVYNRANNVLLLQRS